MSDTVLPYPARHRATLQEILA
ncbi:MAG: hypothetical protein QG613_1585, partial [Pseudomonadota bacterium]|nr:hypothetical protein [Pseudomonadota bacterium]